MVAGPIYRDNRGPKPIPAPRQLESVKKALDTIEEAVAEMASHDSSELRCDSPSGREFRDERRNRRESGVVVSLAAVQGVIRERAPPHRRQ